MLTRLNREDLSLSFNTQPPRSVPPAPQTYLTEAIVIYCDNSCKPYFAQLWVISSALGFHSRCNADFLLFQKI